MFSLKSYRQAGILEVHSETLTLNCAKAFSLREHCCFGISPFNSYFSEEKIKELAEWGRREFQSMHFFVPDAPAAFTLIAKGYSPEEAEWKARRQGQYLKNKIRRALASLLFPEVEIEEMLLDSMKLSTNSLYKSLHDKALEAFDVDELFRNFCIEASKWVLGKDSDVDPSEESLLIAVKYFLAEIPLFADSAGIAEKDSSVFCYHQRVTFLEQFYGRQLRYQPHDGQGFLILN